MAPVVRTGNPGGLLVSGLHGPRCLHLSLFDRRHRAPRREPEHSGLADHHLRDLRPRLKASQLRSGHHAILFVCRAAITADFVGGA